MLLGDGLLVSKKSWGREIVYWPVRANRKALLVQGLTLDVINLPLLKLRQILNGLKASVGV